MEEEELKKILDRLEEETEGMNEEESEMAYRIAFMKHFSTGKIKNKNEV